MFPDFGERTVEICHYGKTYTVSKLSILQYSRFLAVVNSNIPAARAHAQLWTLLEGLLPRKIINCRYLFSYRNTVDLGIYLAFGSGLNTQKTEDWRDNEIPEPPELPDYQFEAARIMAQFPAYNLEKLMAEPASIFFALAKYAARISADKALETIPAGIRGAFGNLERLRTKRGNLRLPNPHCTPRDIALARKREIKDIISLRQLS